MFLIEKDNSEKPCGDTDFLLAFVTTPKLITVKFRVKFGAHFQSDMTLVFVDGHI